MLAVAIFPVAIVAVGMLLPSSLRLLAWLINLILFLVFIIIIGHGVTERWSGLLIDDRYKMSLSRMQIIAWTVLVLSAFMTAALTNISKEGPFNALNISIPETLWLLLGISTTSLIGSPLILGVKKRQPDQPPPSADKVTNGPIVSNKDIKDASWSDIFMGEEVSNEKTLDLGKVQMFYFTVLLVFVYGVMLALIFNDPKQSVISGFPEPNAAVVGLLGISQTAYLVNKVIPRTPSPGFQVTSPFASQEWD
jgi:hypothetical protein